MSETLIIINTFEELSKRNPARSIFSRYHGPKSSEESDSAKNWYASLLDIYTYEKNLFFFENQVLVPHRRWNLSESGIQHLNFFRKQGKSEWHRLWRCSAADYLLIAICTWIIHMIFLRLFYFFCEAPKPQFSSTQESGEIRRNPEKSGEIRRNPEKK